MKLFKPKGKGAKFGVELSLDIGSLAGFVGFASLVASWVCMLTIVPEMASGGRDSFFARLVVALSLAAGSAVIYALSGGDAVKRSRLPIVCALIGAFALAASLCVPGIPYQAAVFGLALSGAGAAAIAPSWFNFACAQPRGLVPFLVACGICTGLLLGFSATFIGGNAARFMAVVFQLAPVACMTLLVDVAPDKAIPPAVSGEKSDDRSKIPMIATVLQSLIFFEVGLTVSLAIDLGALSPCILFASGVAAAVAVDSLWLNALSDRNMSRISPTLRVAALLALFMFSEEVTVAAMCVLLFSCVVFVVLGYVAMSEHVRMSRLLSLRVFAKARAFDFCALALGLGCGWAAAGLFPDNAMAAVRIAAAIAVVYTFVGDLRHRVIFPEAGLDVEEGLHGPDAVTLKRCKAIAERCGLSARQAEVLVLLAKGRSAKFIERELTISLATAQTHIRNIYYKTGVHSKQELINLIEQTKLYGEEE